jgi:Prokaryotic homologs of the JAB domain
VEDQTASLHPSARAVSRGTLAPLGARCRFVDKPVSLRLSLSELADRRLSDLLRADSENEIGGLLVGHLTEELAEVTDVIAGEGKGTPTGYRFEMERDLMIARNLRGAPRGEVIGEYHSHVSRPNAIEPSQDDLAKFSSYRSAMRRNRWLAVILATTGDGWFTIEPYVIIRGISKDVCRPVAG